MSDEYKDRKEEGSIEETGFQIVSTGDGSFEQEPKEYYYHFWQQAAGQDTSYRMKREDIPKDDLFNRQTGYEAYSTTENQENSGSHMEAAVEGSYRNQQEGSNTRDTKKRKKKKEEKPASGMKKFCLLVASAAVFGIVAGGCFQGVNYLTGYYEKSHETARMEDAAVIGENKKEDGSNVIATTPVTAIPASRENNVTRVVENTMPAIVSITSTISQPYEFWGRYYEDSYEGSGSGILIGKNDKELLVVTNNHVVDGAKTIGVTFIDNEMVQAEIKGTDKSADLAVISISLSDVKKSTLKEIKVAATGDSENVKVGEQVVAIGNALGYGQSVTVGYVSAKNRTVNVDNTKMVLLQTDAAINPGNSGGALLNIDGEVIGINSVKLTDTSVEGIGYAIPISKAAPIINELMNREVIAEEEKGYLGITLEKVEENKFNMPLGVFVAELSKEGAAKEAGIQVGDIITKVNGVETTSISALQERVGSYRQGTKITVTVMRLSNGSYVEKEFTVTLKSRDSLKDLEEEQEKAQQETKEQETIPEDEIGKYFDFFYGR